MGIDEGLHPGTNLECDVQPSMADPAICDKFMLKCGSAVSILYSLPVAVKSGKAEVHVQLKHFEIKFPLAQTPEPSSTLFTPPQSERDVSSRNSDEGSGHLLEANQIASMDPTSFICAMCSSSLIQTQVSNQGAGLEKLTYHDLPSEHWTELLEAWMCHQDQKLTERIAQHSKGLWPHRGQAFVGGSYSLFGVSSVATRNLKVVTSEKVSSLVPFFLFSQGRIRRPTLGRSTSGESRITWLTAACSREALVGFLGTSGR